MGISDIFQYLSDVVSFNRCEDLWAEQVGFWGGVLALIAGVLSYMTGHPYITAILLGLIAGKWFMRCKFDVCSKVGVTMIGIGFIIGSILADTISIIVLYCAGLALAYGIHKREYLQSVDV